MAQIDDLPPLRDVIRRYDLRAKKSLGQNFLLDLNLTARIARAAEPAADAVIVEIGPGPGGLTRALLAQPPEGLGATRIIAVERDERAIAALKEIGARYPGRLEIIAGDALGFDLRPLLQGARAKIVANLPYNIATALLVDWLTVEPWPPWYDTMVLMFQREVAARIVAAPGSKNARRLAHAGKDPIRRRALGLRAAAESDLLGRAPCSTYAVALQFTGAATGDRGGLRPTPQDAAAKPEIARRRRPVTARRRRH